MLENGACNINDSQMDQLRDLWSEVGSYPVCRSEVAVHTFLTGLCKLTGAKSAAWLALKKHDVMPRHMAPDDFDLIANKLDGWAAAAVIYANVDKDFKNALNRWISLVKVEGVDKLSKALRLGEGKTRVHLRRDLISDDEWKEDWFAQKYLNHYGVSDRLMAVYNLGEKCEACIILDRPMDAEAFGEVEKNLAYLATAGTGELHKCLFMEHGALSAAAPLSKRERETYRYLLTEMTEGQIAEKMKLSIHTVHDYARGLYKKFGVKGRVGLMALVLGP